MIYEWLTEGLEHPIGDAAGEGVEDGVRRVDGDSVLDARQCHALLKHGTYFIHEKCDLQGGPL